MPMSAAASPSPLRKVGEDLWIIEGGLVSFYGFPYPTRSVLARLPEAVLWVWSPVALNPALAQAVAALGDVRHLVSPNAIHHLYLEEWLDAWPQATLWGPQSTVTKRRDLRFEVPLTDVPPREWRDEIDQAWFRGSPLLDEVVFFHRRTRTAIFADLSENFSEDFLQHHWRWWQRPIARLWKIVEGYGYAPLEWRWTWRDREAARQALAKVMGWQPDKVVMAHGVWQPSHGREYLEQAFGWLRR